MCAADEAIDMGKSATGPRPVDILLSVPKDLKERMVNVITWTQPYTGITTQQKFIREAIIALCDRYETDFNDGEAFEPRAILD